MEEIQNVNVCSTYEEWVKKTRFTNAGDATISNLFPDFLQSHTHFMTGPVAMYNGHTITAHSFKLESFDELEPYIKECEESGTLVFVYQIGKLLFSESIMTQFTSHIFRCGHLNANLANQPKE